MSLDMTSLDVPYLRAEVTEPEPGEVMVRAMGDLDMGSAPGFGDALVRLLAVRRPASITVRLDAVPFLDSSGINALLRCRMAAGRQGCGFAVSHPRPNVLRVLQITGLVSALGVVAG